MITFDGNTILCGDFHGIVQMGMIDAQVHQTVYFGNRGESNIVGEDGGRNLIIEAVIHSDLWTPDKGKDLILYVKNLDKFTALDNGKLEYDAGFATANLKFDLPDVTFLGVEHLIGPLLDQTGTLCGRDDDDVIKECWWQRVNLHFRQLLVEVE